MKVHIWNNPDRYWCGRRPPSQTWPGSHATPGDEGAATCLECLKARRDSALWRLENESRVARETTEQYDRLKRAQRRKARKLEAPHA